MNTLFRQLCNSHLDKLVRPAIRICRNSWSTFRLCGYTGLALAVLLAMSLVTHLGLSYGVMAGILVAALLTFFGLVMLTKLFTGEERLIYYRHAIAVMVLAAALLWLWRQPMLAYLDVTLLGIGLFLACGRVGCLMVGCCHGRPHCWGVRYRDEHAAAGFTRYFVGVRLFPIQAVESLWVLCIVVGGSALVLTAHPPGTALAWYVATYGCGRFCLEFLRGDPERPYLWGFSEAQWISLALMCAVVGAELSGIIPFAPWHAGAAVCLMLTMITVALRRHLRPAANYRLLHPQHIKELAEAVEEVSCMATERPARSTSHAPPEVHVALTSLGIQLSGSKLQSAGGFILHYTFSDRHEVMSREPAHILARVICQLKHLSGAVELVEGNRGVFHCLAPSPGRGENTLDRFTCSPSAYTMGAEASRE